jgi:hypothetical protein
VRERDSRHCRRRSCCGVGFGGDYGSWQNALLLAFTQLCEESLFVGLAAREQPRKAARATIAEVKRAVAAEGNRERRLCEVE